MRLRIALTSFVLGCLTVTGAWADTLVEVVQPKGLVQLGGIDQSASFLYDYSGRSSTGSQSVSAQHFQEQYHLGSVLAVWDPDLLLVSLGGDLLFDQQATTGGSGSNGLGYQYSVAGSALSSDPYPITLLSSHGTNRVVTAFAPSYTSTTDTNQIGVRLLNKILPLELRYNRMSMDTVGQGQESISVSNSFVLNGTNQYTDRSTTDFSLNANNGETRGVGLPSEVTRGYDLTLNNGLSLDAEHKYNLSSNLQLSDAIQAGIPQHSLGLTESLSARFGKSLVGSLTYLHSSSRTLGFDQNAQQLTTDSANVSLAHTLFDSLDSRINLRYQQRSMLTGSENDMGGSAVVNYQKRLPSESLLRLSVSGDHSYADQNFGVTVISVRDELHHLVQQGDVITLTTPGNLNEVLLVKSRFPEIFYLEGRDYLVNLPLGRIEILIGGTILPNSDLYISYTSLITNPRSAFTTDTRGLAASLSLFQNRYLVAGDLTQQDETLVSGSSANNSLSNSKTYHLRGEANYTDNKFVSEYASYDTGSTKYWYLSGGWHFAKRTALADISFFLQDRYTRFETVSGSIPYGENVVNTGTTYSRNLLSWLRASMALNYAKTSGDRVARDYLFFRTVLQGRVNMLQINLSGQTVWRESNGQVSRDDAIHFDITRSF